MSAFRSAVLLGAAVLALSPRAARSCRSGCLAGPPARSGPARTSLPNGRSGAGPGRTSWRTGWGRRSADPPAGPQEGDHPAQLGRPAGRAARLQQPQDHGVPVGPPERLEERPRRLLPRYLYFNPRFVLAKPAIGHFAIGVIMLKRGWMLRYMPPIVTQAIPEYVTFAGYAWAALCFVLAAGTIGVAMTGDMKLWTFYVTVVLVGAKIAAFAIQYIAFRILVGSRLRAAAQRA